MFNRVFLLLSGLLLLAAMAAAEVPQPINYQGRLAGTDGIPVADGSYNIVFTIYDHPTLTAGHDIWTSGTQSVPVADGLFSYNLGSNVDFPPNLTADSSRWLGIKVGGDPEINPRTKLTTVPFAYHAATADALSGAGDIWVDESGDDITGSLNFGIGGPGGQILITPTYSRLYLRTSGQNKSVLYGDTYGELFLYDGSGTPTANINASTSSGGKMWLTNGLGNENVRMEGTTSAGGLMALDNALSELRILATGGSDGGLQTWYNLSTPWISFEADLNGDASANFPDDAISPDEMKGEPGIAAARTSAVIYLASSTMEDIETVTITTPMQGYIVVNAQAWGGHSGTTGSAYSYAQIDETSGGTISTPYWTVWGSQSYNTTNGRYSPIFLQRVYNKPAGTYTFRLEASQGSTSSGANHFIGDASMIATFYPTDYGDVITFVNADEAGQFDNIEFVPSTRTIDGRSETVENNVKVNLAELQEKAELLRKELRRTEMEIRDAERRELLQESQTDRRDAD